MRITPADHIAAAEHHLLAYQAISADFPDWRAVMLFYAAVHFVEAISVADGNPHVQHFERDNDVRTKYRPISSAYFELKRESIKARYLTTRRYAKTQNWQRGSFSLTADQVDKRLLQRDLSKIREYCMEKLEPRRVK